MYYKITTTKKNSLFFFYFKNVGNDASFFNAVIVFLLIFWPVAYLTDVIIKISNVFSLRFFISFFGVKNTVY